MAKTLVERAKEIEVYYPYFSDRKFTKQEIDLALAWARAEIPIQAIQILKKRKRNVSAYVWLAQVFRYYIAKTEKIDYTKVHYVKRGKTY